MKKLILCLLLVLCGCSGSNNVIENLKINIDYETLNQKMDNQDEFILYIGRVDCQDCQEFEPILADFLKENKDLKVYYFDVKKFRDEAKESEEKKEIFEKIKEDLDYDWTPTLQYRKGHLVESKITYLDMNYYDIKDSDKQAKVKEQYIMDIKAWLLDHQ